MPMYKYAPKYVYDNLPFRRPNTAHVYGLRLIGDFEFRYIGSTVSPRSRLTGHYTAANKDDLHGNDDLADWLNTNVYGIEMVILWTGPLRLKLRKEKDKAREMASRGHRLMNMRRPTRATTGQEMRERAVWKDLLNEILDR